MFYGHEFLGAAHNYEKLAITRLPYGRCGKTFSKEFGPAQNIYRKWAEKGNEHPYIASQGLWRGGAHDYSGKNILAEGLTELEKFAKIASDFPYQMFQYSIFCEHKLKRLYLEKVFTEQWKIVKNLPNIILVNTPMAGGDLVRPGDFGIDPDRLYNEIHGNWNPQTKGFAPYMWACDGLPAQDCDIQLFKDRHVTAKVLWFWMQMYNCKKRVDEQTPIVDRKVRPVKKQIISMEYVMEEKGETNLKNNSVFKTHSDQHGNTPKGREQKPCIITNVSADEIRFKVGRKTVQTAPRMGNFSDGRPIYRSPEWGYETQERAKKLGKVIVKLVAYLKRKRVANLGTVNPAFRENAWRNKAQQITLLRQLSKLSGLKVEAQEEIFDDEAEINPDWV